MNCSLLVPDIGDKIVITETFEVTLLKRIGLYRGFFGVEFENIDKSDRVIGFGKFENFVNDYLSDPNSSVFRLELRSANGFCNAFCVDHKDLDPTSNILKKNVLKRLVAITGKYECYIEYFGKEFISEMEEIFPKYVFNIGDVFHIDSIHIKKSPHKYIRFRVEAGVNKDEVSLDLDELRKIRGDYHKWLR